MKMTGCEQNSSGYKASCGMAYSCLNGVPALLIAQLIVTQLLDVLLTDSGLVGHIADVGMKPFVPCS